MVIALILAGGLGLRMNQDNGIPKQFFVLGERPVLIHTLDRFETHSGIDAICIACLSGWEKYLHRLIDKFGLKKVRWIIAGGECRQASVYNGLCLLERECSLEDIVMVHDGVRPFVTSSIISNNIQTTLDVGNAMTSMRSTDTLITSPNGLTTKYAMERESTYTVQTPQTYRLGYGLDLYRRAYKAGRTNTINCCELFIEFGETVYLVNGRKTNIKLTTNDDIAYLHFINSIFNDHDDIFTK